MLTQPLQNISTPEIGRKNRILKIYQTDKAGAFKELVNWFIESLESFNVHSPTKEVPELYKKYLFGSEETKKALKNNMAFWNEPEVFDYMNHLSKVKSENLSDHYWLCWVIKYIDENDMVNKAKIKEKIKQYEMRLFGKPMGFYLDEKDKLVLPKIEPREEKDVRKYWEE
jgi:hypothetical protein